MIAGKTFFAKDLVFDQVNMVAHGSVDECACNFVM
jgi:hypothetical protein